MDKKNNVPEEKQPRFNKETLETMRETLDIEAGKIPSNENGQPKFNKETEDAIQEARDIAAGKIQTKAYHSVEEFVADMDAMEDEEE